VVRIADIEAGSIADELSLEIGSRVVRINGEPVRDGIDFTFLIADEQVELETVTPAGERVVYAFEREPGEAVGSSPLRTRSASVPTSVCSASSTESQARATRSGFGTTTSACRSRTAATSR